MAEERIINIVGTECPPELEDKFNKWYNEVHIPMVMKVGKIRRATRCKLIDTRDTISSAESKPPVYLSIVEFDSQKDLEEYFASPEHEPAMEELRESWPDWDSMRKFRAQYKVLKRWED